MKRGWPLLCLAALAAGGCGQKGPLYLPDKNVKVVTTPASAAPAQETTPPAQPQTSPPAQSGPPADAAQPAATPAPKREDKDQDQDQSSPPKP